MKNVEKKTPVNVEGKYRAGQKFVIEIEKVDSIVDPKPYTIKGLNVSVSAAELDLLEGPNVDEYGRGVVDGIHTCSDAMKDLLVNTLTNYANTLEAETMRVIEFAKSERNKR